VIGEEDPSTGATLELSEFICALDFANIPASVVHQAKRCLIDYLAVALAGSADPSVDVLHSVAGEFGSDETTTVVGRARQTNLPVAVLTNAYMAHVLDYDDTYNPARTTVHGSAPVWPVVFGLSERRPLHGREALAAFIAGFETEVRVAVAAGPAHYEAGWHVTGTVGHFGAAAAASRILGSGPEVVANALGAAGTQAAGLKGVYGSMGKALHPGKAAMNGLLAAMLANNGFAATTSLIEGQRGFLQVFSPDPDADLITRSLGTEWFLPDDGFKPYACGSLTHPTIEGIIALRDQHAISPDQIDRIEATVNAYVSWVTAKSDPSTGLEGKFSISHCAAVAAVDGKAGPAQFEDRRVLDAGVRKMRERVIIHVDDALPKDAAFVTMTLADGRKVGCEVLHNKGTPAKPMSDEEIEAKFIDLASSIIGVDRALDVAARCWRIDDCPDTAEVVQLCRGSK
jgi:2-methylcitrate dehydratase PrpD